MQQRHAIASVIELAKVGCFKGCITKERRLASLPAAASFSLALGCSYRCLTVKVQSSHAWRTPPLELHKAPAHLQSFLVRRTKLLRCTGTSVRKLPSCGASFSTAPAVILYSSP